MTLYTRPQNDIFAGNAPSSEIQPFQAWTRGLGIAFDETNGFPEYTGLNGLFNALNLYIKYLEQNGFAEWNPALEYPVGAGVRVGSIWYRARRQNTGQSPSTSQADWELFLNANALSYIQPLSINSNNEVSIREATNALTGVVQFANGAQIANKTDISRVVNPANAASIAQSTDFGVGQDWADVLGSRALGVFYPNQTDKPCEIQIGFPDSNGRPQVVVTVTTATGQVDIVDNTYDSGGGFGSLQLSFTVPPRRSYRVSVYNIVVQPNKWSELS